MSIALIEVILPCLQVNQHKVSMMKTFIDHMLGELFLWKTVFFMLKPELQKINCQEERFQKQKWMKLHVLNYLFIYLFEYSKTILKERSSL